MPKIAKTIKISDRHESWLQSKKINFSEWVRARLDEEIQRTSRRPDSRLRAVILAAGKDKHLFPLTESIPKALLDIKGKTILQWQVEMLRSAGITDIAVVRGFQKDRIDYPGLQYYDNDDYQTSGSLVSLFSALEFIQKETVVIYGDILFDGEILKKLAESPDHTTLVIDRGWKQHYQDSREAHPNPPELVSITETDNALRVDAVTTEASDSEAVTEFIGLAKLSSHAAESLREACDYYGTDPEAPFHDALQIRTASFIDFIQELIRRGEKIVGLDIWRTWIDVDTFEDYRRAWNLFNEITRS
ncbi:MAG: phosphocholine cytidylyltransferase family protein [Candidatus Neomarinimicrobiota bacterium]